MARSSSESETKAEGSGSPSAPNAGQRSSTSRKATNMRSPSPSGPSRTRAFQPRRSRSTRRVGIPGSPFPTMSSVGARIQYKPDTGTSENPQNANFAVLKFYELRHNGVLRSWPGRGTRRYEGQKEAGDITPRPSTSPSKRRPLRVLDPYLAVESKVPS